MCDTFVQESGALGHIKLRCNQNKIRQIMKYVSKIQTRRARLIGRLEDEK